MKIFVSLLLSFCLTTAAFADCRPDYQTEIQTRVEKIEKYSSVSKYLTGTVAGGVTLFVDVMGVALVGWAGLLIGPQFGALALLGLGGPLWIAYRSKKKKIVKYGTVLQIIEELKQDDTPETNKLLKKLNRKFPELSKETLQLNIGQLDENRALCDGTIANYKKIIKKKKRKLATPRALYKYLKKNLKQ